MDLKIIAIVQARFSSKRLPGKVLKEVSGKSLLEILLTRLSKSKLIDTIIVATGISKENDVIEEHVKNLGYKIFRGSEDNVLKRFYDCALINNADAIVRITGDCPLIDPELVDKVIELFKKNNADYASNTDPPTFPDGLDISIFSLDALKVAFNKSKESYQLEHVTPYIRKNDQFKKVNYASDIDFSKKRWTVDEISDFKVITSVINYFHPNLEFTWLDVLSLSKSHPQLFDANSGIERNEGSMIGTGQKLYKRAKQIIPGGTMLFSKKPELFLPKKWPSYFSKAKGYKVWDMDGNSFSDMSIMGIGTNTLGYGHPEVDDAARKAIDNGNMSTLNCPEEVFLAEKLIKIHPWSDMVRFARTGGEANSIAIRLARAASGRSKVAFCGYHGWHDWYLSSNIGKATNLDEHLLPGLMPLGVPKELKGTAIPFKYNDIDNLKRLIENEDIGIIKMEVSRSYEPDIDYLGSVRELANKNNVILIFDECTSGFRQTFGGLHKKYDVEPDMMMLGKTLGNGYSITAVIGKEWIMKSAEETFISSTFWTERIGPAAALKTLEVMEREKSWEKITNTGVNIMHSWKKLAKKYDLGIEIWGLPALAKFKILSSDWLKYKTYITQEMLKESFLASNAIYVCTEHDKKVISEYFEILEPIFKIIKSCEEDDKIEKYLDTEVCHSNFQRISHV
ncbi:MAG: glutamate-1-semialdehyde aminotransferase [Candidatus Marinimicrobia bacterium]|nr:glutamate-1-semialdehyde aminotransferase [Candidatus Neomarinimicrobiota bacterium]